MWNYTITALGVNQWKFDGNEFISDVDSGCKDPVHIQNDLL